MNESKYIDPMVQKYADASSIAVELRRRIVDGELSFNERLPAERNLSELFGASRGTIRNALFQLEEMNLVRRKVGSGTYVTHKPQPQRNEVAEATSPLELIDVRLAIEPAIARLAVMNANSRNISELEESLIRAENCHSSAETFSISDEEFHITLAECTQNPLLLWIYRNINEVRGHSQWSARKDKILTPKKIERYNIQHRAIVSAVKSRDAEGAVNTITRHLLEARSDLIGRNY